MFERFTERARHVVVLAQEEARSAARDHIDSVALLLGLIREEQGLGAKVLAHVGVSEEAVRSGWVSSSGAETAVSKDPASQQIPFTHQTKACLEMALREALGLGHNYIGTEHILLGVIRQQVNCKATALLTALGVSNERIRSEVMAHLSGPRPSSVSSPSYSLQAKCTNCSHVGPVEIPWGVLCNARECPNCGCRTLTKDPKS